MLERKADRALDIVFFFVVTFIDQGTEYEKTACMTKIHLRYGEIVVDVSENIVQRAWSEEELGSLERMVNEFKTMLVKTFEKHCDYGLYTLRYYLLA